MGICTDHYNIAATGTNLDMSPIQLTTAAPLHKKP